MNPRALTFASLLLAYAGPAAAVEAIVEPPPSPEAPVPAGDLRAAWRIEVRNGELVVHLSVTNTGSDARDVVVAYGRGPGAWLQAVVGDEELEQVLPRAARADLMSRMGPAPSWAPVAAGATLDLGVYRFTLPKRLRGGQVALTGSFSTPEDAVEFATTWRAP